MHHVFTTVYSCLFDRCQLLVSGTLEAKRRYRKSDMKWCKTERSDWETVFHEMGSEEPK